MREREAAPVLAPVGCRLSPHACPEL